MKQVAQVLLVAITLSVATFPVADLYGAPIVRIGGDEDFVNVYGLLGQRIEVIVRIASDVSLGRTDLRVHYAFPGLTFLGATVDEEFSQWEYFTWRHLPDTLFPDSGYSAVDLTAIADLDNGDSVHPDPSVLTPDGRVIKLHFVTSQDRRNQSCHPVKITDFECGQIVLQCPSGDTAYVPAGSATSCPTLDGKTVLDVIDIADGRVCIYNPPDDRGDINLDGVEVNVGDAVLFNRYFIYHDDIWDPVWKDVQILGTDVNDDGVVLTVEDFRYLVRAIARGSIY